MKITKAEPFAVMKTDDESTYQIFNNLEDLHEVGVEPIVELCAELFEKFTGITLGADDVALITLDFKKAFLEETKLVLVKRKKS